MFLHLLWYLRKVILKAAQFYYFGTVLSSKGFFRKNRLSEQRPSVLSCRPLKIMFLQLFYCWSMVLRESFSFFFFFFFFSCNISYGRKYVGHSFSEAAPGARLSVSSSEKGRVWSGRTDTMPKTFSHFLHLLLSSACTSFSFFYSRLQLPQLRPLQLGYFCLKLCMEKLLNYLPDTYDVLFVCYFSFVGFLLLLFHVLWNDADTRTRKNLIFSFHRNVLFWIAS